VIIFPTEINGKISTSFTEVQFYPVEGNERLAKVRIANTQAEPGQDSHCIHMHSGLVKKMVFFCGYHLFHCRSHTIL